MDIPHWAHRRMKMCKHRMAFRIELKLTGGLMLSTQWLWNCSIWFWHTFHLHLCRSASESLVKCFIPIPWMQLCSPAGQRTFPVHAGCTKAGGPDMLFPLIYCHLMSLVKWKFPEIGLRPVIIHFNAIFPYKPSILGYPHGLETPKSGSLLNFYYDQLCCNHLPIFGWIMARNLSQAPGSSWKLWEPSTAQQWRLSAKHWGLMDKNRGEMAGLTTTNWKFRWSWSSPADLWVSKTWVMDTASNWWRKPFHYVTLAISWFPIKNMVQKPVSHCSKLRSVRW